MNIELEAGEYYFDVQGKLRGPLVEDVGIFGLPDAPHLWQANGQPVIPGSVGRLITHVMVIPIPKDADLDEPMGDEFGHLLEAVEQIGGKYDIDRGMIYFTEREFKNFAQRTFLLGDPLDRVLSGLDKLAYQKKRVIKAYVDVENGFVPAVLTSHDPSSSRHGNDGRIDLTGRAVPYSLMPKTSTTLGRGDLHPSKKIGTVESPDASVYENYVKKVVRGIASMLGLPYDVLMEDVSRTSRSREVYRVMEEIRQFEEASRNANKSFKEFVDNIMPALKSDYILDPAPGISRKGYPLIESIWQGSANTGRFVVWDYLTRNRKVIAVRVVAEEHANLIPSEKARFASAIPIHDWHKFMTFVREKIVSDKSLNYAGNSRKPISRVAFDPKTQKFYRKSASGKHTYEMPDDFYKAWYHRRAEYPQFLKGEHVTATVQINDINPENIRKASGMDRVTLKDVRLTFPYAAGGIVDRPKAQAQAEATIKPFPRSGNERWNVCGVAGRDLKAGMVVSLKDGVVMPAMPIESDTKEKPTKYTMHMHLDKNDADLAKIKEAVEKARQTKLVPFRMTTLFGPPVPDWLMPFLKRIGDFNGFGEPEGVAQKTANEIVVQFRDRYGAVIQVPVTMPFPFIFPMA